MPAKLIASIRVEKLYGLYTYTLPSTGTLSNAAILYGDNGVGKSTILRLVFHLLSAANNRGHRTALYKADFKRLEVKLTSNVSLEASLSDDTHRVLTLTIFENSKKIVIWEYHPREEETSFSDEEYVIDYLDGGRVLFKAASKENKKKDGIPRGNKAYIAALSKLVPSMYILNADRRLDSDDVSDPSDEMELRRLLNYNEPKSINALVERSREIGLSQALSAAGKWIARKAVIGTNQGSMNVHSVYVDVLHHLVSPQKVESSTISKAEISNLLEQLNEIEKRTSDFARYELATQLATMEFKKAIIAKGDKSILAAELLQPYIKSLESRLDAIEPTFKIVDKFVTLVNDLLRDKSISYRLSQGFKILNRLGNPLEPSQLSSGEKQLLLLFCYVLTAREQPSVFMIDEPEISLNIKWQRQLVQSLLDITEGATIQFIFASHSIELLTQHKDRVVRVENKNE